jgi:hypothetical protein
LEPVLEALGMWGMQFMADKQEEDATRPRWEAYSDAVYRSAVERAQAATKKEQ